MGALSVADVLDRAADLIEPEGAWTQGDIARTAQGQATRPESPDAVCWCAMGALMKVDGGYPYKAIEAVEAIIRKPRGLPPLRRLAWFNDNKRRTQAEVVAKIREAAAVARGESPHV
jgi:hypothetical protein